MESHKEGIPLFEKHPLNLGIAHLVGVGGEVLPLSEWIGYGES